MFINCFRPQFVKRRKNKGDKRASDGMVGKEGYSNTLQAKALESPMKSSAPKNFNSTTPLPLVPHNNNNTRRNLTCKAKVKVATSHDSPGPGDAPPEMAYEGEDEHENSSMKRDSSACDLRARAEDTLEEAQSNPLDSSDTECMEVVKNSANMIPTGHLSDPGTGKVVFCSSPKLQRSCSNLETKDVLLKRIPHHQLPISKSQSSNKLQELGIPGSPCSVMTGYSADRVMLKKHSSSQVLPSRSRKLWWKMFLWSHRNLHKPYPHPPPISLTVDRQTGYSSDTLEPNAIAQPEKLQLSGSFAGKFRNKGLCHQNQWVAFSTDSSSFRRVEEWVKDLEIPAQLQARNGDDGNEGNIVFPSALEINRSPARSPTHSIRRHASIPEEALHANSIVRSLNPSSTVAHISGIGLKVIPAVSCFSNLRSVNLSANFIVHITQGSLPKGLHMLNLSKNKISTIEGLRELTRLRVLDLSYNRITRIGHGLSNCTLIKELYLAGNKISDVEGLHRLLKLTVLDLSFNKITTMKSLGQLVANYNSLLALNLLGNPIQSNTGEDQLPKAIVSLLPKLAYLNKQPIKQHRARDAVGDNIARAALGSSSRWSPRRKATRRLSRSVQMSSLGASQRSRSRSNSRNRHSHNPLKASSSGLACSMN